LTHLLDTHSLIWFALDDPRLSVTARELIEDPANEVMISPASLWEIAIKVSIGQLSLNRPYKDFVDECLKPDIFLILPIEPDHVTRLASMTFPTGHRDPFDRLLIAQAIVEDIPIIGADVAFDAYPVRRIW
jgi:PIN domain nuclease of toxin-antitoxin system